MAKVLIVTPSPLSRGDQRIIFDIVGSELGISCSDCELVSLIQEEPAGKNGEPSDEQIGRYSDQYRAAVEGFAGTVVCPLGDTATRQVLGANRGGVQYPYGYIFDPSNCQPTRSRERTVIGQYKRDGKHGKKGDDRLGWTYTTRPPTLPPHVQWIVPAVHPRTVRLEGLKSIPCLKAHLGRAWRLASGVGSPVEFSYQSQTVPTGDVIALDLETPRGFIELVGMSDGKTTWASPWNACSADTVNRAMRQPCTWKVMHNAQFDISWLEREGIGVPGRIFDTMLAAHLIQPDLYKGLEKSATLYLDLRPFKYLSTSELARPAADAQVTALLFQEQWRILEKTEQLSLFLDTIMPATRVLMGMTKRGLKVDQAYLSEWRNDLSVRLTGHLARWYARSTVNPFSPSQIAKYLYRDLGLPIQSNKYATQTTDEGALKALAASHPDHAESLGLLLKIRELSKLKSTYSEVEIGPDGCVHPGYLPESKDTDQAGAATGRLASRNPNIQNQPPEARRLFVPHEEGMVLVEADFSQIELRVAAALSQDRYLRKLFEQSGDVFDTIMRSLGCDRVRAKNVVYGSLYGAGPKKLNMLLRTRGVASSESECRQLQQQLASTFPELWGWRTTVGQAAVQERVLTNPFGRKRYFYAGSSDIPAAIDFLPQSCAADILWSSLGPASMAIQEFGGNLLTTVHDSLLYELPKDSLGSGVEVIKSVLEREWPQIAPGFRVPVKIKVGPSWGEMEEYNARTANAGV